MAEDNNLYPADAPKARKRGRRKPRPKHLPPYEPPVADTVNPENDVLAKKQLSAAPAAPTFGAKKGAGNALLFHQLKAKPPAPKAEAAPAKGDTDD